MLKTRYRSETNILFLIFTTFFKIALFVVGGGLAMIPVIEDTFVRKYKLLKNDDIVDMVAMTQTIPGLIAVNSAIFVGHRLCGWKGSVVATIGVLIPSICILCLIAAFFPLLSMENPHILAAFSYIRACVTGIFCCVAVRLGKKILSTHRDFLIVGLLILGMLYGINIILLIVLSVLIGLVSAYKQQKEATKTENRS